MKERKYCSACGKVRVFKNSTKNCAKCTKALYKKNNWKYVIKIDKINDVNLPINSFGTLSCVFDYIYKYDRRFITILRIRLRQLFRIKTRIEKVNEVYELIYTDCIHDSAYSTMSTHKTKKGAYVTMRKFLIDGYNEWREEGIKDGKQYFKFGLHTDWAIRTIKLED